VTFERKETKEKLNKLEETAILERYAQIISKCFF